MEPDPRIIGEIDAIGSLNDCPAVIECAEWQGAKTQDYWVFNGKVYDSEGTAQ